MTAGTASDTTIQHIGIDTGGTFTDFVIRYNDSISVFKVPSTPDDPSAAIAQGLSRCPAGDARHIIHGSTVATNALLERRGAQTALITNKGFEDIIEIGRQNRHQLYSLHYRRPDSLVGTKLRCGIAGRIIHTGDVYSDIDPDEIERTVSFLSDQSVESIAVCLLFSFLNPDHERAVGAACAARGIPVSLSHEIVSEFREYERMSTTLVNAYVLPVMHRYLSRMARLAGKHDVLRIMQSSGGSISAATAMHEPVRTVLSGPAGGVVGAAAAAREASCSQVISFDMGGTSTDVCLIHGSPALTTDTEVAGMPLRTPMIDIHTVGAGGGSIAWVDSGGALRVGPHSAGAYPGPVCYGTGDNITVTDAHLFLGRLVPERFAGGAIALDYTRTERLMTAFAQRVSLPPAECAEGIIRIANASMEKAIRVISIEKGHDPREYALLAFGGAGPMHAAFLAGLLSIPRVIIPRSPGALSSLGMLMADIVKDYSLTVMMPADTIAPDELAGRFEAVESRAIREIIAEGADERSVLLERFIDMRYAGQSYELTVPFGPDAVERFHCMHKDTFGYRHSAAAVEAVNIRLRAVGRTERPLAPACASPRKRVSDAAVIYRKPVWFDGASRDTPVIDREQLSSGNELAGPALITEYSSTAVVPPGCSFRIDEHENIIITIAEP